MTYRIFGFVAVAALVAGAAFAEGFDSGRFGDAPSTGATDSFGGHAIVVPTTTVKTTTFTRPDPTTTGGINTTPVTTPAVTVPSKPIGSDASTDTNTSDRDLSRVEPAKLDENGEYSALSKEDAAKLATDDKALDTFLNESGIKISAACKAIMKEGFKAHAAGDKGGISKAADKLMAAGCNPPETETKQSVNYTERNPGGGAGVPDVTDVVMKSAEAATAAGLMPNNPLQANVAGLSPGNLLQSLTGGGALGQQNLSNMLATVAMQAMQNVTGGGTGTGSVKPGDQSQYEPNDGKGDTPAKTCDAVVTTKKETTQDSTVEASWVTVTTTDKCKNGVTRTTLDITMTYKDGTTKTTSTKVYN